MQTQFKTVLKQELGAHLPTLTFGLPLSKLKKLETIDQLYDFLHKTLP